MHIFHKWSKWSEPVRVNIRRLYDGEVVGKDRQTRECAKCGMVERRFL